MASLWRYHKYRANRIPVVNEPVGQTQVELEAELHGDETVAPVEAEVPAPVKPTRGRNTKSSGTIQNAGKPIADDPEEA